MSVKIDRPVQGGGSKTYELSEQEFKNYDLLKSAITALGVRFDMAFLSASSDDRKKIAAKLSDSLKSFYSEIGACSQSTVKAAAATADETNPCFPLCNDDGICVICGGGQQ